MGDVVANISSVTDIGVFKLKKQLIICHCNKYGGLDVRLAPIQGALFDLG
jgi:hypothetical protein